MSDYTNKPYKRNKRISEEIRSILANIFISDIYIPEAGMITVSKVQITDDLKIAKVYLSFLENKKSIKDVLDIIKSKHSLVRYSLGINLSIKYTPQLRFIHDDTLEHAAKINSLLAQINNND